MDSLDNFDEISRVVCGFLNGSQTDDINHRDVGMNIYFVHNYVLFFQLQVNSLIIAITARSSVSVLCNAFGCIYEVVVWQSSIIHHVWKKGGHVIFDYNSRLSW